MMVSTTVRLKSFWTKPTRGVTAVVSPADTNRCRICYEMVANWTLNARRQDSSVH